MNTDNLPNTNTHPEICQAWIGLDWGDKKHSVVLQERGRQLEEAVMDHSSENLHAWLKQIEQRFQGRAVALGIETSRGAVVAALLQYPWLRIYPINPVTR